MRLIDKAALTSFEGSRIREISSEGRFLLVTLGPYLNEARQFKDMDRIVNTWRTANGAPTIKRPWWQRAILKFID